MFPKTYSEMCCIFFWKTYYGNYVMKFSEDLFWKISRICMKIFGLQLEIIGV